MVEHLPRPIEQVVEAQARRWALPRRGESPAPRPPVIAISRQHGALGSVVARQLAAELCLDFFDRKIIDEIARSTHVSARAVSAVDERDRDVLSEWLVGFASAEHLSPAVYRAHLTRVLDMISAHGGAVILGRGAHLLLGPSRALRVYVVAPLEKRVAEVASREGLSFPEARRAVQRVEADRRAYLARHFHGGASDLTSFDLVVNTGVIGVAGAVASIRTAVEAGQGIGLASLGGLA